MVFLHVGHTILEFYVYIIPLYGYNKIKVLSNSHLLAMPMGALHTLYPLIILIKSNRSIGFLDQHLPPRGGNH